MKIKLLLCVDIEIIFFKDFFFIYGFRCDLIIDCSDLLYGLFLVLNLIYDLINE